MAVATKRASGLTSVVVACNRALAQTQLCLAALLRHTRRPWELIAVVDDDGPIVAFLAGIRLATSLHVEIVYRASAESTWEAGLRAACGHYVAAIDPATIVTDAWLDQLTALLESRTRPGAVGPMSNGTGTAQCVADVDVPDVAHLRTFAERWRRENRGKWFATEQLRGPCILARRDDVASLSAAELSNPETIAAGIRSKGLSLAVARDVFVYRLPDAGDGSIPEWWLAGTNTPLVPKGTRPDLVRTTASPTKPPTNGRRAGVSLTMIVRNEEANVGDCLESARDLFSEIIIVDTGSTDRTPEIARQFGARVVTFEWIDDFAAARNEALAHVTTTYAFWLDADDRIDDQNRERLRRLFAKLNDSEAAYVMKQASCDGRRLETTTVVDHVRLFPVRGDVRWSYRVHEQIVPSLRAAGVPVRWTDIAIGHIGYADARQRQAKRERNLRILEAEFRERPNDPFVLFNLGWIAIERREWRTALGYLRASLAMSAPRDSIVSKLYVLIVRAHHGLGEHEAALMACKAGLAEDPENAELLFREGIIRRECGDATGAEACWRKVLAAPRPRRFLSVVNGIFGHITRRLLAELAEERGATEDALRLWNEVLAERPDDSAAIRARDRLERRRRTFETRVGQDGSVFATESPPGDELASIVILCCNEVEYTRLCLESVLRWTRLPYELLLVDNGSTDGTHEYLESLRERPGPDRVVVVHNEINRGFPAGCNQGIAQARGRYIVLLNNDTVVTEGWLGGLIARAADDGPSVGLAGAVSNATAPPQQIGVDYDTRTLNGLNAFAARRRREFAGRVLRVERLTGFCLLARREVFDRIGALDEQFGLGFFDDDDLCVRARQAGFQLVVALDVFVHHFGSRTFRALGIDSRRQLENNFGRFREKWGPAHSAGYRVVPMHAGPRAASSAPVQTVSLCMIVRNEAANLANCLASVADLVTEVVIVDTGSTDGTDVVASRFGARLVRHPWADSFAAARNESLRHATGDWAFWMDGDERLDEANRSKLRALFAELTGENTAYVMSQRSPGSRTAKADILTEHVRLFRRLTEVRWIYRVREQILPALRRTGADLRRSNVVIEHVRHEDEARLHQKAERDLRLLSIENQERPDDPFVLYSLGVIYHQRNRPADALPVLRRSLERSEPRASIVPQLHARIVACLRQLGQPHDALEACREGRRHSPNDELLFHEALILRELGDVGAAEATLLKLLGVPRGSASVNGNDGLRGYKARHNLAVIYEETGRTVEAEAQWRAAVAENPQFIRGWLRLGKLYRRLGRWDDLEGAVAGLAACPGGSSRAAALRTRASESQ